MKQNAFFRALLLAVLLLPLGAKAQQEVYDRFAPYDDSFFECGRAAAALCNVICFHLLFHCY